MEAPNSGEEVNEGEGRSGHAYSLCRGYDSCWQILDGEGGGLSGHLQLDERLVGLCHVACSRS